MNINYIEKALEAVMFATGDPISIAKLSELFEISEQDVEKLIERYADKLDQTGSALAVIKLENKYQLSTRVEYAPIVEKALDMRKNTPLSQAALEVLAIVAYNQPISKGFIEQIRGVDSSGIVNNLVIKRLIEEGGRLDIPGRPIGYKTTANFLRCFNIDSLTQLPELKNDIDESIVDVEQEQDEIEI